MDRGATPSRNRLSVFGNRPPPGMGEGAIPAQEYDPYEKYWDIIREGKTFPGRAPVWDPEPLPPLDEKIARLKKALVCGTYFVKRPNWLEPPITARNVECSNETFTEVTVAGVGVIGGPVACLGFNSNFTILCQLQVPDRFLTILTAFGRAFQDPLSEGNVEFGFFLNGDRVPGFESFRMPRGELSCPCPFPMTLPLKWQDDFCVAARPLDGQSHFVAVRLVGYQFPVHTTSGEGAPFPEFHTL